MRLFTSLVLLISGASSADDTRRLQVEVEILELSGPLTADAFSAQLTDAALDITGIYSSPKHIQDVTARQERVMPIGKKWWPIPRETLIQGSAITRNGWRLQCLLEDSHPAHPSYRLVGAYLHVPMPGHINGLPQPSLEIRLFDEIPTDTVQERSFLWRSVDMAVTVRVRTQWVTAR